MHNFKLSLTDLPHDIFHNLIFPTLSINDIAAVMMTCKAAFRIVERYDGHGSIERCQIITSISRMHRQTAALIIKFPRLLLNLYILQRRELTTDMCINKFANNLLKLTCSGQCAETLTQPAPYLQKLTIRNHAPNLNRVLDKCCGNSSYFALPALTHLTLDKIIYNGVISIYNTETLKYLYINFVETPSPIYINNLPNLTDLYISTQVDEHPDIYDITNNNIGETISIIDAPNISFLSIRNYVVKFDITQLTNLGKIILNCVNYIPGNSSCELFQIDFNEAFPILTSLSITDSASVSSPGAWPPQNSTLCDLSNLDELHLTYISQLVQIGNLSNIKHVDIDKCYELVSIESASYIEFMTITSCCDLNNEFRRHCVDHLKIEGL